MKLFMEQRTKTKRELQRGKRILENFVQDYFFILLNYIQNLCLFLFFFFLGYFLRAIFIFLTCITLFFKKKKYKNITLPSSITVIAIYYDFFERISALDTWFERINH